MAVPEWFDFKQPDYERIYTLRAERLDRIRADASILPGLKEHYKDNPADFITDWGMTFDPRNAEVGLPTVVPFLLFPKQEEFVNWIVQRWRNREDGLAEKSRDMGISWLCVAIAHWMWQFHAGTVIGFGSRKEEYVDKIGDPKSLFWKARQYINLLPVEFRPAGYVESKCAPHMRILNPETHSAIVGEAGDNIGRGNRTSIYFKDESAFYNHADAIDAALSQTSNCKIDVSTANGNGNPFYQKRHSGKIPVFSFHWREDPRKDDAWYRRQQDTLDPQILAQEVDIDYNASTTDSWIPGQLVEAAQAYGVGDLEPIGPLVIGVDAAHFGDDESIISPRKGRIAYDQIIMRQVDGPTLAAHLINYCETAPESVRLIVIELDGPGISCYDQLKRSRFKDIVRGVHTGARMSDHKNYNLRAAMYRRLKEWLGEGPVRLPNDKSLKSQMASIKYGYKDGLLLLASKKDMKGDGFKSPDRADGLALTFAAEPPDRELNAKPQVQMGHQAARRVRR